MAGNARGSRTLTGGWGEVWVDDEKIFVLQKIEQRMGANRGGVQIRMDVDSKMTRLKGSGILSIRRVYSRAKAALEKLGIGRDVCYQITAELKDPDAVDGQIGRWSTDDVWWNTIPVISRETGGQMQGEWKFGLTLSGMKNLNEIKQDGGIGKWNRIKRIFLSIS